MDIQALKQFLLDSNAAGYIVGDEKQWIKEPDSSTTIPFTKKEWSSHDNFFGGEPYGGRLVVSYNGKPCWIMVYYGWVAEGVKPDSVYAMLRKALKNMPADYPVRGPKELVDGEYLYQNTWNGAVERYVGEEQITLNGNIIYKANYLGGLVDQQLGV